MTYTGTLGRNGAEALAHRAGGPTPILTLCRLLQAASYDGELVLHDAVTGIPRVIVRSIASAAKLTVEESGARGVRFAVYRPFEASVFRRDNAA